MLIKHRILRNFVTLSKHANITHRLIFLAFHPILVLFARYLMSSEYRYIKLHHFFWLLLICINRFIIANLTLSHFNRHLLTISIAVVDNNRWIISVYILLIYFISIDLKQSLLIHRLLLCVTFIGFF